MGTLRAFGAFAPLVFLTACSQTPLRLNPGLLQPFSYELERAEPFPAPFVSAYSNGKQTLVFVAAAHGVGPANPTFRTIAHAVETYQPKFVIVEGRPFTTVSDPRQLIQVKECEAKRFAGCEENTYALSKAAAGKIPFSYGEPTDPEVLRALQHSGNSESDVLLFYGARQIPQWKREGVKTEKEIKAKLETALPLFAKQLGTSVTLDYKAFTEHYQRRLGKPFRGVTIDNETVSPQISQSPTWLNLISNEVGVVREAFLIKQMETRLNEYQSVLVVYGSGHLVKQRKVLQKAFPVLQTEQPPG